MAEPKISQIKADLHNHFSTFSRALDPNKVADRVRSSLGSGGMCALVNYEDCRYEAFARAAEKAVPSAKNLGNAMYFPDRNVLIIRGQEVPTRHGDLLVLGMEEGRHLTAAESFTYTASIARDEGGYIIAPHPFFCSRIGSEMKKDRLIASEIDAIEVFNGGALFSRSNELAGNLWAELVRSFPHLGKLSTSDGHSFAEVGRCWTELRMSDYSAIPDGKCLIRILKDATYATEAMSVSEEISQARALMHTGIILAYRAAQTFHIRLGRGDKEALIKDR